MKNQGYRTRLGRVLLFTVCSAACFAQSAMADLLTTGVDLGAAGRTKQWAIFTLGALNRPDFIVGGATIGGAFPPIPGDGDVGASGNGRLFLEQNAVINGDVYYHTPGQLLILDNASIKGTINHAA